MHDVTAVRGGNFCRVKIAWQEENIDQLPEESGAAMFYSAMRRSSPPLSLRSFQEAAEVVTGQEYEFE